MPELESESVHVVCTGQADILNDPNRIRAAFQGLWNLRAARKMVQLLDSFDPIGTVVHLHGWTKSLSSSVIRPVLKRHIPVICTMHEYFIACPNGGFYDYRSNSICHLRGLSLPCLTTNCDKSGYGHKLWRVGRQIIQKSGGHLPGGIKEFIAISRFSRNILEPYLPPDARIHQIVNPVFVDKTEPVPVAGNDTFLFVGRLTPEKGVFLFAEAARLAGVTPHFVGDGECRDELVRRFPDATVTGWLGAGELEACMRRARALVLPSLWYETQGLVVAEAAARGIPAIVPENSAAAEAVLDGRTGLCFARGSAPDLATKMMRLKNPDLARTLGREAYRQFWEDPPTLDRHLDRLEPLYHLIAGTSAGGTKSPEPTETTA
jgi:glycosyltransferase involved in cell wall biosynthesis